MNFELTEEEKRLLSDPNWRLDNLYFITNKAKEKILFKKNRIQQYTHDHATRFNCTLKPRQVGISTYWLLKYLDIACFNENVTVAILSHEWESLRKLFKIIRYAHRNMDPYVQPVLDKGGGSQYRMYFPEMNSEIYCTLEAVSDAVSHLHISEMALNEDPDKIKTSMDAVPVATGNISIETTCRGFNHFYDFWMEDTGYKNFFFPWYMHEEYFIESGPINYTEEEKELIKKGKQIFGIDINQNQIAFRRFKIAQKESIDNFLQEYPEDDATCFIASGNNPFKVALIKKMYDAAPKPIEEINGIRIYKKAEKNKVYVIGADTAEGFGGDACAAHVFEAGKREQVATFKGNLQPGEFAEKLVEMADMYDVKFSHTVPVQPLMGVERNNHGHAVLLKLNEILNYTNLFAHNDEKLGWKTDAVTRPVMVNAFIESVQNGTTIINDRETLGECLTLVNNNGKIEAEEGKHDDLFMAACISVQLCIEEGDLSVYSNIGNLIRI